MDRYRESPKRSLLFTAIPCYPLLIITVNLFPLRLRPLPFERRVGAQSGNRSSPLPLEIMTIASVQLRCWTNAEVQPCHCACHCKPDFQKLLKIILVHMFFTT